MQFICTKGDLWDPLIIIGNILDPFNLQRSILIQSLIFGVTKLTVTQIISL